MLEQTVHAEQINKKRVIRNNGVILIWRSKQYSPNRQIKITAKYSGYYGSWLKWCSHAT